MSNISWSTFQYNTPGSPLYGISFKQLAATKDGSIIAVASSGSNNNYLTYKIEIDNNGNFLDPNTWQKLKTKNYNYTLPEPNPPVESATLTEGYRSISNLYSQNYLVDPNYPDMVNIPSVFCSLGTGSRSYQILGLSGENTWVCDTDESSMSSTQQNQFGDYKEIKKAVMTKASYPNYPAENNSYQPNVAFIFKLSGVGNLNKIQIVGLTGYSYRGASNYIYETNYWRGMQGAIRGTSFPNSLNLGNFKLRLGAWNNSDTINNVMSPYSQSIDDLASNYSLTYNNTGSFLLATSYSTNAVRKIPMDYGKYSDPYYYETSFINEPGVTGIRNIAYGNGFFVATPLAYSNKVFFTSGGATEWKSISVSGVPPEGDGSPRKLNFSGAHLIFSNAKFILICDNYILESYNPSTGWWLIDTNPSSNLKEDQNIIYSNVTGRVSVYAGINKNGSILIGKEKTDQFVNIRVPSPFYAGTKIFLPPTTNVNLPITYSVSGNIFKLDTGDNSVTALYPGYGTLGVNQPGSNIYNPVSLGIPIEVKGFSTKSTAPFPYTGYMLNLSGVSGPYQLSKTSSTSTDIILYSSGNSSINYVTSDIKITGIGSTINNGWARISGLKGFSAAEGGILNDGVAYAPGYQQPGAGEIANSSLNNSIAKIVSTSTTLQPGGRAWSYHGGAASVGGQTKKYLGSLSIYFPQTLKSYIADTFLANDSFASNIVMFYDQKNCTTQNGSIFDCMTTTSNDRLSGIDLIDGATNGFSSRLPVNCVVSTGSNKVSASKNIFQVGSGWQGLVENVVDPEISGISSIAYDDGYDLFMVTSTSPTGRHIYISSTGDFWTKLNMFEGVYLPPTVDFKEAKIIAGQGTYTIFGTKLYGDDVVWIAGSPSGPWSVQPNGYQKVTTLYKQQHPVYVDRSIFNLLSIFAATTTGNHIAYLETKNLTKLTSSMNSFWERIPSFPTIGSTYTFTNLRTNDPNQSGYLFSEDPSIISVNNNTRTLTINKRGSVKVSINTTGTEIFEPLKLERTFFPKLSQTVSYNIPSVVNVGSAYQISLSSNVGLPVKYTCSDPQFVSFDFNAGTMNVLGYGRNANITVTQDGNESYDSYVATYPISSPKGNQSLGMSLPATLNLNKSYDLQIVTNENLLVNYSSSNSGIASINNNKLLINRCGAFSITASNTGSQFYNPFSQTYSLNTESSCLHLSTASLPSIVNINNFYPLPSTTNAGKLINYSLTNSGIGRFLYSGVSSSVTGLQITGYGTSSASLNANGDGSYYPPYSATYTFTSYKSFQSYTWSVPTGISVDSEYTLATTSSAGLPLTYSSSNPSVIQIDGNFLYANSQGSASIFVNAPSSSLYEPIVNSRQSVVAYKIVQSGTGFKNIPRIAFVGSSYQLEEFTSAGQPITYVSSNTGIARIRIV